jgi:glycosyltransferase involved in cell wall biosynthesis
MPKIFLVDLEPIETRYTWEWQYHLPKILKKNTGKEIVEISGDTTTRANKTSPGAFLDFNSTNIYKSEQAICLAELFQSGEMTSHDTILFTDAWNPAILMAKYMKELGEAKPYLAGIWHAGCYDPNDFLGRIENKNWAHYAEKAIAQALDISFFATRYHYELFLRHHPQDAEAEVVGFPMEYIIENKEAFTKNNVYQKENIVVFPHRLAPEKRVELFDDAMTMVPNDIEGVVCQRQNLKKQEYYEVLSKSKLVFSASLQETLGIGVYEGMVYGADYIVPDRLSYKEIYRNRYSTDVENPKDLAYMITKKVREYENRKSDELDLISEKYFSSKEMCKHL